MAFSIGLKAFLLSQPILRYAEYYSIFYTSGSHFSCPFCHLLFYHGNSPITLLPCHFLIHFNITEALEYLGFRFAQNWHTREISFSWQASWIASTLGLFFTVLHCILLAFQYLLAERCQQDRTHKKEEKHPNIFIPFPYSSLAKFGMA